MASHQNKKSLPKPHFYNPCLVAFHGFKEARVKYFTFFHGDLYLIYAISPSELKYVRGFCFCF